MDEAAIDVMWHEHRPFLVDLAFRMLGNFSSAEDVVQDAFARLLRVDLDTIDDVRGWLVVVVSRLCLDDLRSARSRRQVLGADPDDATAPGAPSAPDPADRVTLDDCVRTAMLVVLQQLSPAERTVFVLHDVFQYPFETAASIVGRSPEACRQLASRARRRIGEQAGPARFAIEPADQQRIAERFIAACAGGDLDALMELLDPEVAGEVDLGGRILRVRQTGREQVSANILRFFGGHQGVTLVSNVVDGHAGALAFRERELIAVLVFDATDGRISEIHATADPTKMGFANS